MRRDEAAQFKVAGGKAAPGSDRPPYRIPGTSPLAGEARRFRCPTYDRLPAAPQTVRNQIDDEFSGHFRFYGRVCGQRASEWRRSATRGCQRTTRKWRCSRTRSPRPDALACSRTRASGTRSDRPGLKAALDFVFGKAMCWSCGSSIGSGRSLPHLIETVNALKAAASASAP